jgi:hypothetical protein
MNRTVKGKNGYLRILMKIKPRKGETVAAAYQRTRDERMKELQEQPLLFKPVPESISPTVVGLPRKPYG